MAQLRHLTQNMNHLLLLTKRSSYEDIKKNLFPNFQECFKHLHVALHDPSEPFFTKQKAKRRLVTPKSEQVNPLAGYTMVMYGLDLQFDPENGCQWNVSDQRPLEDIHWLANAQLLKGSKQCRKGHWLFKYSLVDFKFERCKWSVMASSFDKENIPQETFIAAMFHVKNGTIWAL